MMQCHGPVKQVLASSTICAAWDGCVEAYNKIPLVDCVELSLEEYVVQGSVEGLFVLINLRVCGHLLCADGYCRRLRYEQILRLRIAVPSRMSLATPQFTKASNKSM